jgi:hypothetical protein
MWWLVAYFIFREHFQRLTVLAELSSVQVDITALCHLQDIALLKEERKYKKILPTYQKKLSTSSFMVKVMRVWAGNIGMCGSE